MKRGRNARLQNAKWETLEARQLMSASALNAVESFDGTGNNLANVQWGSTDEQLLRKAIAAYTDGVASPAGADRPSAREISNAIAAADPAGTLNDRNLSAFVYAWGQFLDHDIDLTTAASPTESFNVAVPANDPSFDPFNTGTAEIPLNRSIFDTSTGTSSTNPRQQISVITAWIDGSVVYGSDATRAAALRSFIGGMLKTSDGNLLPFNTDGLANANDAHIFSDDKLFVAGDVRANENIELTSIQTLFMREHNRLAAQFAKQNPTLTDEQLYQKARKVVIAEIQAITYNEFLPALLGQGAIARYQGYNPNVNPGIANEFSTAAFRLGHSMLGDDVEFLDNDGQEVRDELPLAFAFFNPSPVEETGIDPILKYLSSDRAQEIDNQVVDGVRNFLFGPPGAGGLDLATLNIQRGRDHGLADYNSVRAAYGLPKVTSFSQITSNAEVAAKLQEVYGSVDNIDLWVGGLAEDHVAGSSLGPTFRKIVADQFTRLRDGDRFWYERNFSGRQLDILRHTKLADIIRLNTGLTNLQSNVFFFDVQVGGQIFNDRNANGRRDFRNGENGMSGWTVEFLDTDGNVLDTAVTDANGRYNFSGLDLGTYKVHVVAPAGFKQTTPDYADIKITEGRIISNFDYGYAASRQPRPRPMGVALERPSGILRGVAPPLGDLTAMI